MISSNRFSLEGPSLVIRTSTGFSCTKKKKTALTSGSGRALKIPLRFPKEVKGDFSVSACGAPEKTLEFYSSAFSVLRQPMDSPKSIMLFQ